MAEMLSSMNLELLRVLYGFATSGEWATALVVFFARWFPYVVFATVVIYEFYAADEEHRIRGSLLRTVFASFLAWMLVELSKYVDPAPRPYAEAAGIVQLVSGGNPFGSFPSAHAAFFGALAGTMLGNRFRAWGWYLLAAVVISLARVAAGVHWPIDVLVGITFGFALGFFITRPLSMVKNWGK